MSITAKAVWGIAKKEFNKEDNTPGGVPFSYTSKVSRAYENYISAPVDDNYVALFKQTSKAYEWIYTKYIRNNQEFSFMVSTLFKVAFEKMNGKEFKRIISECDPDQLPFLIYFHNCIYKKFISEAEQERADNANLNNGYHLPDDSRNTYRKLLEPCHKYFGCRPEYLNDEEIKELYDIVKAKNILGSKPVSFDTFCTYIKENSIKAAPVINEETGDDLYAEISDNEDFTQEITDDTAAETLRKLSNALSAIKISDKKKRLYAIDVAYDWLSELYKKDSPDIGKTSFLRGITNDYRRFKASFVQASDEAFEIIVATSRSERRFPTKGDLAKHIGKDQGYMKRCCDAVEEKIKEYEEANGLRD